MASLPNERLHTLTDREKQTLRMIVRGHDAKSIARTLDLSVHTINERLRSARQKMAVSSSREAARLLLETEAPNSRGDTEIGEAAANDAAQIGAAPIGGARRIDRPHVIAGVLLMILASALLFLALPQAPASAPPAAAQATDPAVVDAARHFLELGDQQRWDDAYRATGASFRKLNTAKLWADTSVKVRVPLGAVVSRTFVSQDSTPTPPAGNEIVKFRTSFANKADALETVALARENGGWRVVGIYLE